MDLLVNEHATLKYVYSFLGIEFKEMKGQCIKNTSDDLRNAVANFYQLCPRYVNTYYVKMFDELLM